MKYLCANFSGTVRTFDTAHQVVEFLCGNQRNDWRVYVRLQNVPVNVAMLYDRLIQASLGVNSTTVHSPVTVQTSEPPVASSSGVLLLSDAVSTPEGQSVSLQPDSVLMRHPNLSPSGAVPSHSGEVVQELSADVIEPEILDG